MSAYSGAGSGRSIAGLGLSFSLPDDTNLSWAISKARQSHSLTRSGLPTTGVYPGKGLDAQPANHPDPATEADSG
jgi:hypothetical protein